MSCPISWSPSIFCFVQQTNLSSRTFDYSYTEASTKQPPLDALCDPSIGTPNGKGFLGGTMLYPAASASQTNQQMVALQQQMANENRLLWATLTPHGGTRHYVAADASYPLQDEHYEVIDFASKSTIAGSTSTGTTVVSQHAIGYTEVSPQHVKRTPIKVSWEYLCKYNKLIMYSSP